MIVKDKAAALDKANAITSKIITLIQEESKKYDCEDDPAEQIYLSCHIIGNLLAKVALSLEGYGKIYDIADLSRKALLEWINVIAVEHLKANDGF